MFLDHTGSAAPSSQSQAKSPRALQKKLPQVLETVLRQLPSGTRLRLLFQDEARFGCLSDQRRCWAPWPLRPMVAQQTVR